ncbi:MAG TPA: LysM peptidoglycan-binding domain-containing protein [Actinophytocola sp.]|uniref:LysM peptidoglycan-binding domain-containing protein n=1 Tax=Actinophytocola sp. TaxID=1872138 RepID=UPI002DDD3FED|nr:LysM peptidoglycan-binding domain-containing protein [Actinophytocola sp.]HEV2783161.1 LysM peptidoglycan-binding domain-containing protein [Actinophytocola sp.]
MAVLEAPTNRSPRAVASAPRTAAADTARPPGRRSPASAPRVLAPVACDHRRAPISLSLIAVLALAVCLAVVGLAILGNAGSGASTVPNRTAVVRVEPGESLLELAERVAPRSDPAAVVERIRELNGLSGSEVRPGQPLRVPSEG